jgi:hypothetical protein
MNSNLLSRINIITKIIVLTIAVGFVVGTSNGDESRIINNNLNLSLDLNAMSQKVEADYANDIYSSKDTFSGYLTGYGADCPLCGGHLACMPSLDVLHGNIMYQDATYGNVRIVASSQNLACGSVIRFQSNKISTEPTIAIVLDRGVTGTSIDLLSLSESDALTNVGRSTISYDVIRKGW